MKRLRLFLSTMGGRLYLILLGGMLTAAVLATLLTGARRELELERQLMLRAADRLQGYAEFLDSSDAQLRAKLLDLGGPGIIVLGGTAQGSGPDRKFEALLAERGDWLASAAVQRAEVAACLPKLPDFLPRPGPARRLSEAHGPASGWVPPACWLVELRLSDGTPLQLGLMTPERIREGGPAVDPLFLALLAAGIAALAYLVSRIASTPLARLADAATRLGHDLQHAPLPVEGPLEVRRAAQAFNVMQERLQQHLSERTQMLAAITHDLQTPLTRLRLRLENVEEEVLRGRLVGDLAAMQALIREGLELARSAESSEKEVPLDLDSLLESMVEDAADAGAEATFERGCGAILPLRPLAMSRLFSNLMENALKYGNSVRVLSERDGADVVVRIRDSGAGLPESELETVFNPFVRVESSRSRHTGGTGLGLTIARVLAERNGASLTLRNHPQGGLEAILRWVGKHPSDKDR